MSIKESNLVTILSTDLSSTDTIRVLDGDISRRISVQEFSEAQQPILESLGFVTTSDSPSGFSQIRNISTITSNYTLTLDDSILLCDTTASSITITLPLASTAWNVAGSYGQQFTVKRITSDSNTVTINPDAADLLDGGTITLAGSTLDKTTFISDGSNWWVVA